MSDIIERLRDYAKSYRGGFWTTGDLLFEAAKEIERLEAELAEANAKIARVERTVAFLDPGQFDHSLALRDGGYSWGFHKGRSSAVADVRHALKSKL